ncbi:hypothetical protein EBB59_01600 [Lysobacter pythonis]|uniref:Uncharacterized protein n=1 Tax=Solilutibacter pythonis TaxID=2483112 RepID=A0A3M2I1Z2_9GAMM|nr:hypothetical protein [Lysobacter pythonis]RMH94415.1 hypothetical protein EBB59_01600 [Lysobacter pythonis]
MKHTHRVLLAACLAALSLAACKKEEAQSAEAVAAPAAVPAGEDRASWQSYLGSVAEANMDGVSNAPFAYFLPAASSEDFQGEYDRLLERVQMDLSRGIIGGNMLMFGSPVSSSTQLADLVVEAFKDVKPNTMKEVKVVFVGNPADKDRVSAAVAPAGLNYVFVSTAK